MTDPTFPPPSPDQQVRHLRQANAVADAALRSGHHPFGALLVGPDHETVLLSQGNVDAVNHAESVLAREAARRWSPAELWRCTLYTTVEPCAMCAGTQYWSNIGRVVYGMSEARLLSMTGAHAENPTLNLPCRAVFDSGQKPIEVLGPVAAVEAEIAALHQRFWQSVPLPAPAQGRLNPQPYFHDDSATVRFWVECDHQWVGATIGKMTLHYRFMPGRSGDEPLATYQANAEVIDAAVRRRVAGGSVEPVMLREHDLSA